MSTVPSKIDNSEYRKTPSAKQIEREEVARKTAIYKAAGSTITHIARGVGKESHQISTQESRRKVYEAGAEKRARG